ncbi:PA2169 family four-helix-bundle protein [bacterium]|nr:PA2169 family four-helix-bundle protein [bacterium]
MSRNNQYIAILEKLLTHLKNSKLEYLKAADHADRSEKKRYFNKQALLRNRFFQEILSELQNIGIGYDDFVISRLNFDQLLISSIDKLRSNALDKCLESDKFLLEIYLSLRDSEFQNEKFLQHSSSIEIAIEQNQIYSSDYQIKNKVESDF